MSYDLGRLLQIYEGSNGDHTAALYKCLVEQEGHAGAIAVDLFRACKASERAKNYRGRFVGAAYDKKQWSMDNLAKALHEQGALGIEWGWAEDMTQPKHRWVLYVELPTGQVSFHTLSRGVGPDHRKPWDQVRSQGPTRICKWIAQIMADKDAEAAA